jgi:hypothetical protein
MKRLEDDVEKLNESVRSLTELIETRLGADRGTVSDAPAALGSVGSGHSRRSPAQETDARAASSRGVYQRR